MFNKFPKIPYDIDNDGTQMLVTNVMKRFILREELSSKAVIFYDYQIKEGERPDIVAFKFYGDYRLDWLVMITNRILDPHFDWFKSYYDFRNFIIDKYGSIQQSQQTIHHYEWIIQQATEFDNSFTVQERTIIVDEETHDALPLEDRKIIYDYDYERDLNEERANIKLLKTEFVPNITKELETIFNG